jgi:hypothetical protein
MPIPNPEAPPVAASLKDSFRARPGEKELLKGPSSFEEPPKSPRRLRAEGGWGGAPNDREEEQDREGAWRKPTTVSVFVAVSLASAIAHESSDILPLASAAPVGCQRNRIA